jgi:hypothetical protein
MNWIARSLIVAMMGAATSVVVAAVLIYFEARNGQTLFAYSVLNFVPVGAVGAGLVASLGYFLGFLALRVRPTLAVLLGMIAISAGVVFLAQSAEFGLFLGARGTTKSVARFSNFLVKSVVHTPLTLWSAAGSGDGEAMQSAAFAAGGTGFSAPAMATVSGGGDGRVDSISGGVQGVVASQDVSNTSTVRQMTQMDQRINSIGSRVKTHGGLWAQLGVQTAGFMLGGVLVFLYLRQRSYCRDCMLLLRKKGVRTRYYSRTKDMRSSVDDVLTRARDKQLQQSIHAHIAKGAEKDGAWSEYCSTMEIRRCTQCRTHRVSFRTRRKTGESWKDIDLLGFTALSNDPLDFA